MSAADNRFFNGRNSAYVTQTSVDTSSDKSCLGLPPENTQLYMGIGTPSQFLLPTQEPDL
jgi:hypothetical protein